MATGGVKKTRAVGNRAHKNRDKIGFTVLTFSEGLRLYVPVCVEHVNWRTCPCACVFVYVSTEVGAPACLY